MKLPDQVTKFGFVGERKAMALLCLGFYVTLFGIMGLIAMSQIPEWTACFFGLGFCYLIGFFAVAADWFWGRWFAVGLGYSGLWMAGLAMVTTRQLNPAMMVFGITHAIISVCLLGEKMAAQYEAKTEWRERWHLDDQGVIRIRQTVQRAAASLPSLIMWVLAPRDGGQVALLALTAVGIWGVVRGRTWGVMALFGAGAATLAMAIAGPADYYYSMGSTLSSVLDVSAVQPALHGGVAGALLLFATLPFARPIFGYLARRHLSE
jgi:hypothetical protein